MAGIFVKYWRPYKSSDGKIGKTADQLLFPGTLQQFRQKFKGVCVIGYHNVDDDGVILENSQVLLNEPYVMPPELANESTPVDIPAAASDATKAVPVPQPVQRQPSLTPVQPSPVQERIYESGDSFIKIAGDKVYQLRWKKYDDSEAPFDRRVRATADGEIEVTVWEELSQGEVRR